MAKQNQDFSKRLDEARRKAGYRWKDLAEAVGINPRSVPNYSRHGRVPEWDILVEIAQLLNVSCDWLLTGAGEGEGKPAVAQTEATTQLGADQLPEERIRELLEKAERVLTVGNKRHAEALAEVIELWHEVDRKNKSYN